MIPDFESMSGTPFKYLPEGIHTATMEEVKLKLAFNARRERLFAGLQRASEHLFQHRCPIILLDGSFVSDKAAPGDYDGAWVMEGADLGAIEEMFLCQDRATRDLMKRKYGGELFPVNEPLWGASRIVQFFQTEKITGEKKGIIRIDNPALKKESDS